MVKQSAKIDLPLEDVAPERLHDIVEAVHGFTVHWFHHRKGEGARAHVYEERSLSADLVAEIGIGYVPASSDGALIVRTCHRSGIGMEELVTAGIASRNLSYARSAFRASTGREAESGEELGAFFGEHLSGRPEAYSDAIVFKLEDGSWSRGNYLVLPYRTRDGQGRLRVASWKARALHPNAAVRYQALRQSPIFSRSGALIGLEGQERALQEWGEACLVEGEFDSYALAQSFRETQGSSHPPIFLMGTSRISRATGNREMEDPLRALSGLHVTLFLDRDGTGRKMALGNVQRLVDLGCIIHVAEVDLGLPAGGPGTTDGRAIKDVSDLLRVHGSLAVRTALARARTRSILDVELALLQEARMEAGVAGTPTMRMRLRESQRLIEAASTLPEWLRDEGVSRVADTLSVSERLVEGALARSRAAR